MHSEAHIARLPFRARGRDSNLGSVRPFRVRVADEVLDDLALRLERTRWTRPSEEASDMRARDGGRSRWRSSSWARRCPAGFAMFPKELSHPPREWAERFFDVTRWTEMPRGGHFAAMEEPAALADEIRAFFRPLRGQG